jgi:hypothetical protein
LLLQINTGISPDVQRRFNELVAKRQTAAMTPAELRELTQITDAIEQRDAQRLAALIELAQLHPTTVRVLMDGLGIRPQPIPEQRNVVRQTPCYVARESINTFTMFFFLPTPKRSKISRASCASARAASVSPCAAETCASKYLLSAIKYRSFQGSII